jgi:predicted N-formylglutamate amidohydrolase
MIRQTAAARSQPQDFASHYTLAGSREHGVLLVCDHARNALPAPYGTLGLPPSELERHIAYDIGVEAVTAALAARLDLPAVLSCFLAAADRPEPGRAGPDPDHAAVGRGGGARQRDNHFRAKSVNTG